MAGTIFDHNLDKNPANYAPLTPLSFLERAAYVYPQRTSVIHGGERYTWSETYARCRRLASALAKRGIGVGQTVAAMLPNTPPMYECHFGVAMTGAVLNTLNTRLDAQAIAFMLEHGEAKLLITDREFAGYRIDGIIGRGGMGVVYRATDLALDRTVALKVLVEELADDPAFQRRFVDESKTAASLDHPNIVPI